MKIIKILGISLASFVLFSCASVQKDKFTDKNLTKETKNLSERLKKISKAGIAFGHQEDTSYGVGWQAWDDITDTLRGGIDYLGYSDVCFVADNYPAVFGFEIGNAEHKDSLNSIDGVPFKVQKKLIREAYQAGGVITVSWHADNPATNGDAWDMTPAIGKIFSDEKIHAKFDGYLQNLANFLSDLKDKNGAPIPVIFRPWHEMNGDWFWWGGKNRTPDEYVKLWKYTVETLRDKYKLHNLLYCYSPNLLKNDAEYLAQYPGDDFVDMLGIDIYDFKDKTAYQAAVRHDLALLKKIADKKNKIYAFTETGIEGVPVANWWTDTLLPVIKNTGIAYVLVWRNHTVKHHYAPYPASPSAKDFKLFKKNKEILFLKETEKIK